jgi:hypothetical protein
MEPKKIAKNSMNSCPEFAQGMPKGRKVFVTLIVLLFTIYYSLFTSGCFSQVSINTTGAPPDNSAMLDVSSTSQGTLIPCITTAQRNAISSPAPSLLIFNISSNCFEAFINGTWSSVSCPAPCVQPLAPNALPATVVGCTTSFTANWTTSPGATTYYIDIAYDYLFTSIVTGYSNLNVGNVTSFLITGLTINTTYYYRVRAASSFCPSINSNIVMAFTGFTSATAGPSDNGTTASCTSIIWNWTSVPGASGYKYGTTPVYSSATNNGASRTHTQSSPTAGITYSLYVWAYDACNNFSYFNILHANTPSSSCCSNPCCVNPSQSCCSDPDPTDCCANSYCCYGGYGDCVTCPHLSCCADADPTDCCANTYCCYGGSNDCNSCPNLAICQSSSSSCSNDPYDPFDCCYVNTNCCNLPYPGYDCSNCPNMAGCSSNSCSNDPYDPYDCCNLTSYCCGLPYPGYDCSSCPNMAGCSSNSCSNDPYDPYDCCNLTSYCCGLPYPGYDCSNCPNMAGCGSSSGSCGSDPYDPFDCCAGSQGTSCCNGWPMIGMGTGSECYYCPNLNVCAYQSESCFYDSYDNFDCCANASCCYGGSSYGSDVCLYCPMMPGCPNNP